MVTRNFGYRLQLDGGKATEEQLASARKAFDDFIGGVSGKAPAASKALDGFGESAERAGRRSREALKEPPAGLKAVSAGAENARGELTALASRIPVVGPALAALGPAGLAVAAGLAAIAAAGHQALKTADEIGDAAERIGVTNKALQEYRFAATGAGLGTDQLDGALLKFTANLGAAQDGAQQQQQAFLGLGVAIFDAGGKVRKTEDVFRDVADAIAAIEEPQARAAAIATILGEKVGPKMAAFLAQGAKGFDEAAATAKRFGAIIGDDVIKKADELDSAINRTIITGKAWTAEAVFRDAPSLAERMFKPHISAARELLAVYEALAVHPLRKALEFATGGRFTASPAPPSTTPSSGLSPPIADAPGLFNLRADKFQAEDAARALGIEPASAKEIGEGLAVIAQGLGLVLDKGQLVRKEQVDLAKATLAVNAAIAQGGERLAAFGGDADKARAALEAVTLKLDPLKSAVKALNDEAALLRVPEGFERDLAKAAATLKEKLGRPLTDSDIKPLATAQFDSAIAREEDFARQTDQAAAAQERLAKASSTSAASQREATRANALAAEALKLGLNPAQVQYIRDTGQIPFVNAKAAAALGETAKAFDRQNRAAGAIDAGKFNDAARIAIQSAENLADAAGLGEAAARKAAAANAILAAGDHAAAEEAKQAAIEQAKVREIRNELVNTLDREIEANDRLAAAAAKGAAAAALQAAEEAKLAAKLRLGEEATAELAEVEDRLVKARVSAANLSAGQAAGKAKDEAEDQKRLGAAIEGGRAALARYHDEQAAVEILRGKGIASLEALSRMTGEEAGKLKASTAALIENNRERREQATIAGVKQRAADAGDELEILRAENATIGINRLERAVMVQGIRDEIAQRRALETVSPKNRAALIEEFEALKSANAELAKQRELAQIAQDNARAFTEPWVRAFDNLQDAIGEALKTGKLKMEQLGDIGKRMASELIAAFLRINVLNPIGAAIGIPGIVNTGSVFFGGGQAQASAPAQSLAGGALNAAGNVNSAIGFFDKVGNFIKNPSATLDSIGNFFSNPFGLFGSAGPPPAAISPLVAGPAIESGVGALTASQLAGSVPGVTTTGMFSEAAAQGAALAAGEGGLGSLGPALAGLAEAAPYIAAAAVAVTLLMSLFKKTPHPAASFGFLPQGGGADLAFSDAEVRSKHINADAVTKIGTEVLQPYLRNVAKQYGVTFDGGQIFSAFGDKTYRIGHDFFGQGDFPVEGGPPGLQRRLFEFDPEKQNEVSTALARLTLSLIQTAPAVEDVNVKTAAMNISLEASGEEINKALGFAAKFTETMKLIQSGFDPVESQMAQISKAASEFGDKLKTTVTDFRDQAVELKLATPEEANAALQTLLKAQLGLIDTGKPLEGLALQLAQTKANFEALKPALEEAGFSAEQASGLIAEGFAKFKDQLGDQFLVDLSRQANEAMGRGFLNGLSDIGKQADAAFADALRLFDPSDPRLADAVKGINDVFGGLVNQALAGLDADQLQQVIAAYDGIDGAQAAFIRQMAQNTLAWRNVTAAVEQATRALTDQGRALIQDLGLREFKLAGGSDRDLLLKRGAIDKSAALAAAFAEGLNPDDLARLAKVIDGELNKALQEFDANARAAADAATQAAEAQVKAARDFGADLTKRELAVGGDTRGAFIAELQQRQLLEREAASAAGRTNDEIARLTALLALEFDKALADFDAGLVGGAAALRDFTAEAAAFNADLGVRLLRSQGADLAAALAEFDLNANQQRAKATEIGGDLTLLETVLGAERLGIIQDFNDRALEEQRRAADEALREQQRAEEERQRAAEQAAAEAARAEEERQRKIVAGADFASNLIAQILELQGRDGEAQLVRLNAEAAGLRRQAVELGVDTDLVEAYVRLKRAQIGGQLGGGGMLLDPGMVNAFNSNLVEPASRHLVNLSRATGERIRGIEHRYDGAIDPSGLGFGDLPGGSGAIDVDLSAYADPQTQAIKALHADEKTLLTQIRDELRAIRAAAGLGAARPAPSAPIRRAAAVATHTRRGVRGELGGTYT